MQEQSDGGQQAWVEVAVEVAGVDAELAADLLRQACPGGVAIEAPSRLDEDIDAYVLNGDAPALVKGYLPAGEDCERLISGMRIALQTAPLQREPSWRDPIELEEREWRDSWKKYFGVQRFGERTVVAPSWIEYTEKDGETVIRIDPGMAFGTGQHPTTAMCLAALEEYVREGSQVLDLGCGSGILAIAAARFGAGRVLALDTDEQAVKATSENLRENGVGEAVEVREGSLEGDGESFDLVVANISGLTLQRLAPAIASSLVGGGKVVASGFLDDAVEAVRGAFESEGLMTDSVREQGVWRCIVATRP
jgi:ribosomal protein L11 methyltransferase